ncbi:MAG: hypothetical protein D6770_05530 [Anaerolineae bacterium]|nr:MAG: hypothetical protein D6770_05530 [Anaerolineae bacterium]
MSSSSPQELATRGKAAFKEKRFDAAIQAFSQAVTLYEQDGDTLNAAEMKNNLSVALLQAGRAREALEAVSGTDQVFAEAGDVRRQALALGNQAAALEALGRLDEALTAYQQAADLLADIGEGDLRSSVLQAISALKLRRGKFLDSAISMIGSVESATHPTLLQRFLRFLLRLRP